MVSRNPLITDRYYFKVGDRIEFDPDYIEGWRPAGLDNISKYFPMKGTVVDYSSSHESLMIRWDGEEDSQSWNYCWFRKYHAWRQIKKETVT